jgi:hypothetical protein
MTDTVLTNLVSSVPPYSVIVFDEMDKQYPTAKKNPNINLSDGGILTAIDGVQRLSYATIVIMIVNDINLLDITFRNQLLRHGRIDQSFTFTQIL